MLCSCCSFANSDHAITFWERLMAGGESSHGLCFLWTGELSISLQRGVGFRASCVWSSEKVLMTSLISIMRQNALFLSLSLSLSPTANCREMRIWAASIRTTPPRACSPFTRLNCAHPHSHISAISISSQHHTVMCGIYFCVFCTRTCMQAAFGVTDARAHSQ